MAATVSSPWAKPSVGSWALDSEENEAELQQHEKSKKQDGPSDFPSLSAAIATKSKKKKGQTLSLAEFSTYSAAPKSTFKPSFQSKGPTHEDLLALPTGPRERTAEELDRSRLGGGFRSYGANRNKDGEDSSNSRWGSNSRDSDDTRRNGGGFGRDSGSEFMPSRADETDDWGAGKKSLVGNGFERKERGGSGGGFFDSQSKADESDNWGSNKSFVSSEVRRFGGGGGSDRERRGGFELNGGGADSESWGKKKDEGSAISHGNGRPSYSNGSSADSELWGKKKEEGGPIANGSERPRLKLQPRTLPVNDVQQHVPEIAPKQKASNPFGEARPREEVLAEKGQDWKKMDEELESVKIKESGSVTVAIGRGSSPEDRGEKSWRKPESVNDVSPQRFASFSV